MKKFVICLIIMLSMVIMVGCHQGEIKLESDSEELKGKMYVVVEKNMQDLGFKNVTTTKIEDLVTGGAIKDGEVEKVTINGETSFKSGDWIDEDAKIVIYYHAFQPKEESPVEEASEDPEEELETEHDKTRKYECGETAHYDDFDITVENPVETYKIPQYANVWFKVPVHIESKTNGLFGLGGRIGCQCFGADAMNDPDALPSKDEHYMKKGEVFDGYIYIDYRDKKIEYMSDDTRNTGTWEIDETIREKLIKNTKPKKVKGTITVDNNKDFKKLMETGNPGETTLIEFSDKYAGNTLEFDGCVIYSEGNNLLVWFGNYTGQGNVHYGPEMSVQKVKNNTFTTGENVHVKAKLRAYSGTNMFILNYVEISRR